MLNLPPPPDFTNFLGDFAPSLNIPLVVYGLLVTVFVLYTLILLYHWIRYGEDRALMKKAITIYFITSSVIIAFFTAGLLLLNA